MREKPKGPEEIHGVLNSQFSIARFYGGITFNGEGYTYFPENEGTLIRNDILKARAKEAKKPKKAKPDSAHPGLIAIIEEAP